MKNRNLLKNLLGVLMTGLMVSCMGMEDTAPNASLMPEFQAFDVHSDDGYDFWLSATLSKEDVFKIEECGFYLSEHKNMQGAEKIVSKKLFEQEFMAEISLTEEDETMYVCAYLSGGADHMEVCSEMKKIVAGEAVLSHKTGNDLSKSASANCYIVSEAGVYRFRAVKGNGSESVGDVKSAEVLWESFGTSTTPNVGDLIKSVFYDEDYVIIKTADTFREGNAVIAVKDASGTILWSWHIWLTDTPGKCVYANNAGTMMDRNLGATSATPGDVGALGLLYQWGRKDPFLGSSSISRSVEAKSTITWPSPVSSSSSRGTLTYATEHPTTFITYNDNDNNSNNDWYYTGSCYVDETRWQSEKTIFDPCPAGWRVPDGGSNGVWEKAGFGNQDYNDSNKGRTFGSGISSPATWYPAAGIRAPENGVLLLYDDCCHYWSATAAASILAYILLGDHTGSCCLAYGNSVRCLQE